MKNMYNNLYANFWGVIRDTASLAKKLKSQSEVETALSQELAVEGE